MRFARRFPAFVLAVLLACFPVLTAGKVLAASPPFAWGVAQTVEVGYAGGWMAPALTFANGRTGLESYDSDLVASQDAANVYVSSYSGGFLDVGAVDFDRVIPLSGSYKSKVPAVAGHVYLFRNGTQIVKFVLTQVVRATQAYGLPTLYTKYASGTLTPNGTLPSLGSVDLGRPGGDKPVQVNWEEPTLVSLGDVGGITSFTLDLKTGRTGLYTSSADLVIDQQGGSLFLASDVGSLLDLGTVQFSKASLVAGDYVKKVPAVSGHVYLYQAGATVAKFQVIQAIAGEGRVGATYYLRYSKATVDPTATLPGAGSIDMGRQAAALTAFDWPAAKLAALGNVGGFIAPAFNVTTGQTGLFASDMDIAVEQSQDGVWLESHLGELVDLGSVNFSKVIPLTGNGHRRVAAIPGHVYFYRAGTTVAKLQLTQVIPDPLPAGTPRLFFQYTASTISPDTQLPKASSLDLGGWAGAPATPGSWSCVQTVTVGRVGGWIAPALTFSSGRTGLPDSTADLVVEQKGEEVFFKTYSGGFLDLGAVNLEKVPPLTGSFVTRVTADPDHVYLFQSGLSVVKFQAAQVTPGIAAYSTPKVALRYAATTITPDRALPPADQFDPDAASAVALTECEQPVQPDQSGTGGSGGSTGGPTGGGSTGGGSTGGDSTPAPNHALVFQEGNASAMVDGVEKTLDVAPQSVSGNMMVPLRFLGEALGAQIGWDPATRRITYDLGEVHLDLWVGKTEALLNGETKSMSVPPTVIDGRTLVPLRFVGENLGANVKFDGRTNSVGVASGEAAAAQDKAPTPDWAEQEPEPEAPELPDREPKTPVTDPTVAYAVQDLTRLVKVDLQTGLFTTVFETIFGIHHFRLNPSGTAVAYEDGRGRLLYRSLEDGEERVLYTPLSPAVTLNGLFRDGTRRFAAMPWSWSPDGESLLFLSLGAFDRTPTLLSIPVWGGDASSAGSGFDAAWGNSGVVSGDGQSLSLYDGLPLYGGRTLDYEGTAPADNSALSYMASLSDNGQFVAYIGRNGWDLFLYNLSSDSQAFASQEEDIALYSFPRASNTGSTALVAKLGNLWLVTGDGTRQVTNTGDLSNPDW